MSHKIAREVKGFIRHNLSPDSPILIAVSGGPDSRLLLELMRELWSGPLHVAHVNHRARRESDWEEQQLQALCEEKGIPFHVAHLGPVPPGVNKELWWREQRYAFFAERCAMLGGQAVLLGHHRDDQAETVLKRLFEGAHLEHLAAMRPMTEVGSLRVGRPLLRVSREEIQRAIQERGISAFTDPTNLDPCFLRGRLRSQVLSTLEEQFGKNVRSALCTASEQAAELGDYLERRTNDLWSRVCRAKLGTWVDVRNASREPLELKYFIRQFVARLGLQISRDAVNTTVDLLLSGAANRRISLGKEELLVDRGRLLFLHSAPGTWHLRQVETVEERASGWEAVLHGRAVLELPPGEYRLGAVDRAVDFPGNRPITRWWTANKVPAAVLDLAPLVYDASGVAGEFLSGRFPKEISGEVICLELSFHE